MRLLLDTHIFIWFITASKKLQPRLHLFSPTNSIFISSASLWEIAIKSKIGKLDLGVDFQELIEVVNNSELHLLDIKTQHIAQTLAIPTIHNDPFDRLLIAQSINENLQLVTDDKMIKQYPISIV